MKDGEEKKVGYLHYNDLYPSIFGVQLHTAGEVRRKRQLHRSDLHLCIQLRQEFRTQVNREEVPARLRFLSALS